MTYHQQDLKPGTAYILWLFCVFGICGLHRLYLGKVFSGLLYLFTFGLFGFWQFIDILLIPGMAKERNLYLWRKSTSQKLSHLTEVREKAAKPQKVIFLNERRVKDNLSVAERPKSFQDPILKLLKVAASHNNVLSLGQAVISMELPVEEVEKLLKKALKQNLAYVYNDDKTGAVRYRFDI